MAGYGPFNDALYICRHFADSILTIGRHNRIAIAADGTMTTRTVTDDERQGALVEEFGISEEIAVAIPPDVE